MLLSEILAEEDALTGACGPELDTGGRMERRLLLVPEDIGKTGDSLTNDNLTLVVAANSFKIRDECEALVDV